MVTETDDEARYHFTSVQQSFTNLRRGTPGQVPPPIDDIDSFWSPVERTSASQTLLCSVVGSPETAERRLLNILDLTQPDEIIITAHVFDHKARLRSLSCSRKFVPVSPLRSHSIPHLRFPPQDLCRT